MGCVFFLFFSFLSLIAVNLCWLHHDARRLCWFHPSFISVRLCWFCSLRFENRNKITVRRSSDRSMSLSGIASINSAHCHLWGSVLLFYPLTLRQCGCREEEVRAIIWAGGGCRDGGRWGQSHTFCTNVTVQVFSVLFLILSTLCLMLCIVLVFYCC